MPLFPDAYEEYSRFQLNGQISRRESLDRRYGSTSTISTFATGVIMTAAVVLRELDVVTNLSFAIGTTGVTLGTSPHCWLALYDYQGTLMAQSTDDTAPTITHDAAFTKALTSPQTCTRTGPHYAAMYLQMTGGVMPTLKGATSNTGMNHGYVTGQYQLGGTFSTGTPFNGTAPNSISPIVDAATIPYVLVT